MNALALLLALAAGIAHAPTPPQDCRYTVAMVALSPPPVMAGNMRTTDGGCLIWTNLEYAGTLRRKDACQLAAHETNHLAGAQHSADPNDLMYSPFRPLRRNWCR